MSESLTLDEFVDAVYAERGGQDAFSVVQKRLVYALAAAMKTPTEIDPLTVSRILSELPPIVKPVVGGDYLDVTKLSDDELSALDSMYAKAGTNDPPEPGSPQAQINTLLDDNAKLLRELDLARDQERIARDGEKIYKDLLDGANVHCNRLEAQLAEVKVAIAGGSKDTGVDPNPHVEPRQGLPEASNIVPFDPVNAPVVTLPLAERYPGMVPDRW
jgi:hypothetical protein